MGNKNDTKRKVISSISGFFSRILGGSLKLWKRIKILWEWFKKNHLAFLTFLLALGTFWMAFHTRKLALTNTDLVNSTNKSNERARKLFVGQNKPLVDVTPIGILQHKGRTHSTTLFSVANYSGFVAHEIGIDVKYGEGNAWITKWVDANDLKSGEGLKIDTFYRSAPKLFITKLEAGETVEEKFVENPLYVSGSLDLETKICADPNGYPVFVRVTWQNKYGHVFDEVHEYRLICTKDSGRAFAFIPEGIISKKD